MKPRKVLAVDDSKLMLRLYEVMLRPLPLATAAGGLEALACLRGDPEIDLVLLDLNMPGMDGLQLLDALREEGLLARLTVVFVTTEGHEEAVARGIAAGASAHVTKPFDRESLLGMVAGLEREPAR